MAGSDTPPANVVAGSELLERLDRLPLSRPHYRIRRLGGFGYLFDTFDGTLMGYAMAAVIALWQIEEGAAGWLLASVFVGYLVGALGAGILADRYGRRRLMMIALGVFTVFSLLMSTAQGPAELFVWRMLSGIGLGAESVLVAPYVAEFVPARYRSAFLGRTVAYFGYGSVLAGLVAVVVIGPNADTWWGWRVAGVIAALPILLLLVMRRTLPESPRYLIARGRIAEASEVVARMEREAGVAAGGGGGPAESGTATVSTESPADPGPAHSGTGDLASLAAGTEQVAAPVEAASAHEAAHPSLRGQIGTLFRRGMRRRTMTIWLLWFTLTGVNYGFTSWMVNMLIAAKGFSVGGSFGFALLMSAAQVPGYLFAAWLAGRFEKKWVIACYAAGACLAALGVAVAPTPLLLLITASLLAAFINGAAAAYYPYTAELYPTEVRTTGVGFASAVGRIGAIASPIAIGYTFGIFGFEIVFLGLVAVLAISVITVVIVGERTGGRTLEQIGKDAG